MFSECTGKVSHSHYKAKLVGLNCVVCTVLSPEPNLLNVYDCMHDVCYTLISEVIRMRVPEQEQENPRRGVAH